MSRFKNLNGKEQFLNIEKSRIDWQAKSLSKFQKGVKDFLYSYWKNNIVYEEMPLVGTKLRLDFFNATKRIAIECNGKQHAEYNKFFHNGNRYNYLFQMQRDGKKYRWCEMNSIILVEIEPNDVLSYEFFQNQGINL